MLKVAIIADDLTGANDSGVQFAKKGLATSVLMQKGANVNPDLDVVIIDTDSRSQPKEIAYERVRNAARTLGSNFFNIIYKKIDSTMRGNVGVELDAFFDAFQPDILVLAPGYPMNYRKVKNGFLYIEEKLLHETDFAQDPKNPMYDSFIPNILSSGTDRPIGQITLGDFKKGSKHIQEVILEYWRKKVPYILFDSAKEDDFKLIVESIKESNLNAIWSGSAGLANHLIDYRNEYIKVYEPKKSLETVLMVIGSVNESSRKQLDCLLQSPRVRGIILHSHLTVQDKKTFELEIARVLKEIEIAIQQGLHIALYSSGELKDIELTTQYGQEFGLTTEMISNRVSEALGVIASSAITNHELKRLFLTGGDTAKSVCDAMNISEFRLIDEVEMGVPIGILADTDEIVAITKAGGFGSLDVLLLSLEILGGEQLSNVQT